MIISLVGRWSMRRVGWRRSSSIVVPQGVRRVSRVIDLSRRYYHF